MKGADSNTSASFAVAELGSASVRKHECDAE